MPFRGPLKRDIWEPSVKANEIGEQWNIVRKSGAKLSFSDSDS